MLRSWGGLQRDICFHSRGSIDAEGVALATAFAYWCLPQVFFYALYALTGEVLNARGVFGPYAWAPVANSAAVAPASSMDAKLFCERFIDLSRKLSAGRGFRFRAPLSRAGRRNSLICVANSRAAAKKKPGIAAWLVE